jgi:hypothetical protein
MQKPAVLLLFIALTVAMTWPQARHLSTHVHDSDDPLLSIWRISWIAHALAERPADLLNGNIFHPEPRTMAYSDAVLLQGVVAAPLIGAGVSNIAVYNVLVLVSIALSGWAMWLYAARLTGSSAAGVIAGVIYAFVPFRFDHFMHLELHATFFLPLSLLALERVLETRSRRDAVLLMAALAGQVYSGIYYAVFLATALMVIIPFRIFLLDEQARAELAAALTPAMIGGAIVVTPYLLVYVSNRVMLGERQDHDIAIYSATLANFFAASRDNVLHGAWSGSLGASERRLFLGFAAMALAALGAAGGVDRRRATLLVCAAIGVLLAMGFNTPVYEWIRALLVPYRGLRAPARAAVLVFLAVAPLAAFGYVRLVRGRSPRAAALIAGAISTVMVAEYYSPIRAWLALPAEPPQVYRWLAAQPRVVVAELPFAQAHRLDAIHDGLYMFHSTYHWQPLVNGYSGFFPQSFLELTEAMKTFPDPASIAALKERDVDLVVIHGRLLGTARYGDMTAALLDHPDFEPTAQFDEVGGTDMVFRLRR